MKPMVSFQFVFGFKLSFAIETKFSQLNLINFQMLKHMNSSSFRWKGSNGTLRRQPVKNVMNGFK